MCINTLNIQTCDDGLPATLICLTNNKGLDIVVMDIGATWLRCQLALTADKSRNVLLGAGNMADFYRQNAYMGSTIGRYANRIAQGSFFIDDNLYQVSKNQQEHCLHGGEQGFDKRRWRIEDKSSNKVVFSLISADGDQGFPGKLTVFVSYEVTADSCVVIDYRASTDKATVVNLTNHAYFNLLGENSNTDCLGHYLSIDAAQYVPTDAKGIPQGGLALVQDSGFDFNKSKAITTHFMKDKQQQAAKGYDHCFVFDSHRNKEKPVASLLSPDNLIRLNLFTDKPAMQLYTGNWLAGTANSSGGQYQDYSGIALETQFIPDSPNQFSEFQPSCILRPEQLYQYSTRYQFEF